MQLKTNLPLEIAAKIVDAALVAARREGTNPMTVVVLDVGGHPIAMKREDGSGIMRFEVAQGKAWGALGMGLPSRAMRDRFSGKPTFLNALCAASDGKFVPVPSGVLIRDADGAVIGAVGVSGDTSEKDEFCAIEGVKVAGLTPDPSEPEPNWRTAQ